MFLSRLIIALATPALAADNGEALLPPMGWRSWNCFYADISDVKIRSQIDALTKPHDANGTTLKSLGYGSIGIDEGWAGCSPVHYANGTPTVDATRFPDMPGLVDYGHSKGVKMGFYLNGCGCHETVEKRINYEGDVRATVAWGFDGVKIDSCGAQKNMTLYYELFNQSDRPLSIENCHQGRNITDGGNPDQMGPGWCPYNQFRTSGDIVNLWDRVMSNLISVVPFLQPPNKAATAPLSRPGCWAYPDMLEVGRMPEHNAAESRSHFSAWALVSAPLILGFDLSDDAKVETAWPVISNREVIAISQQWVAGADHPSGRLLKSWQAPNVPTLVVRGSCGADDGCVDTDSRCAAWAKEGQCWVNSSFMTPHCRRACGRCEVGNFTSWRFEPQAGGEADVASGSGSGKPVVGMLRSGDVCLDLRGQLPGGHEASNHLHALPCDASQPTQRWAFNGTRGTIQSVASTAHWQQQQQKKETVVVEQRGAVVGGGSGGAPCLRVFLHWLWNYVPLVDTAPCDGDAPQPPPSDQWTLAPNGTLRNGQFGCVEVSGDSGPPSTIWAKPLHGGGVALLAINGADMPQRISLDLAELLGNGTGTGGTGGTTGGGVGGGGAPPPQQWRARDVWAAADLGTISTLTRSVAAHDCVLLVLSPIAPTAPTAAIELSPPATVGRLRPARLRANRVPASASEPGAIDSHALTVTWDLECATAGACLGLRQEAYRLRLRDTDGRVALDTGRRATAQPQHSGVASALRSARRYTLEVTVWSGGNGAAETTSSVLHTAILEGQEGWQGEWIGGFTQLRGDFRLAQPRSHVVSALAHATGVGCFALTVNGHAADASASNRSYMNPGWANIPTVRMLYRQFDVAGSLFEGENVLGARLGQCKFGYEGSFCSGAHGSLSACRAFNLQLTIVFQDGTQQVVASHASSAAPTAVHGTSRWLGTTALNPIRYTHLYHGEIVDARLGTPDWDTPASSPTIGPDAWQPAQAYAGASELASQFSLLRAPPIAATDEIAPTNVTALALKGGGGGTTAYVFDFGNNMAGFARMVAPAQPLPAGTVVTLRYGEVLGVDGSVSQPWGDGAGINHANQTDQYTARGVGGETFTPSFTYHGFRFVQVEGLPAGVVPGRAFLTALFVRTAMPRAGRVEFGERYAVLNQIQAAVVQTQASNVHAHPTDCPQREKRGWTGDGQVTSGQCSLNFDSVAMYATWLQTMADSASVGCALAPKTPTTPQPNTFKCCDPATKQFGCDYTDLPPGGAHGGFAETSGSVADVVPYMGVGGWPGDPSWGLAGTTIPWEVMTQTGDESIVSEFYGLAKGVVDFFSRQGDPKMGGLVSFGYYGDWLSLEPVAKPQIVSWSHVLGVARLVDMATRIGEAADAARFAAQLANLTRAYRAAYEEADGTFGATQTANVLALYLNLTEGAAGAAAAAAALTTNLGTHGNRTQSGLIGASYVLQALTRGGAHELALAIASAVDEPSWGYMVKTGPGTIWETWDDTSNSHNHPMFTASIGKYLYAVAGLQPEAWRDALVPELRPGGGNAAVAAALGSASVSVTSRRGAGPIQLSWSCDETSQRFHANASVPHGFATALLIIPIPTKGGSVPAAAGLPTFTLRERRSGLHHSSMRSFGTFESAELCRAGVLRVSVRATPGDHRAVEAELAIVPGQFEFVWEVEGRAA